MLEQLYSEKWISQKGFFSILLGFTYAVFGIASALVVFPTDPALAAVAFTSLLLLPSLNNLLTQETKQAAAEKNFDLTDPFKNHKDIFVVYFSTFLGILLAFSFFSLVLPSISTSQLFSSQIAILGPAGQAAEPSAFGSIVSNNLMVFVVIFFASFIYGAGSIFVIAWNASVWGVIFAITAQKAAYAAGQNPVVYFTLTILAVFPHMFFEAAAYFMVAISGAIVGRASLTEKFLSDRFTKVVQDAVVIFFVAVLVLLLAAYIETFITGKVWGLFNL